MKLTDAQRQAVRSWDRGDICVVAGPGSGKTRVLVERLRWLIADRKVAPERILAITFTEKAANEMRARLVGGSGVSSLERAQFEAAQISTIDAFCNRLLREHSIEAGVDPGFEILDEDESRDLLRDAIEHMLDEAYVEDEASIRRFLASYAASGPRSARDATASLQNDLAMLVHRVRSYGCEPSLRDEPAPAADLAAALRELAEDKGLPGLAELAARLDTDSDSDGGAQASLLREAERAVSGIRKAGPSKALVEAIKNELLPACLAAATAAAHRSQREWLLQTTQRILTAFRDAKLAAGRMDFDDVLAAAADLLASDSCPELRFEHVLIDEFQDTNPLQVLLVERILEAQGRQRPVRFVVGDINQSIYGFRHADQNVFRRYRLSLERRGGDVIRLLDNFRSRPDVLAAVHAVMPGGPGSGVEAHRLAATNRFPAKSEPSVEVQIVARGGASAAEWEATRLARRLHELKRNLRVADRREGGQGSRSLEWGDVAVLVRTHNRAAEFAGVLRRLGVPCRTGGGRGLFAAPETAELGAFLRVVRNPRDEISLAAVLKSPFCGIDDAALLQLKRKGRNLSETLSVGDVSGGTFASRLERFRDLLATTRADRATIPVRALLARAVATCGYRTYLAVREDGQEAVGNLDQLLEWIGRREEQRGEGLEDVSAALDRALETRQPASGTPDHSARGPAVEVLTMHAAKGLEFPVVALASLQSEARAAAPGLVFSPEHGIGARWLDPAGNGASPDQAYRLVSAETKQREREEADRLLYVAMTRAEEHLLLSASFPGDPQKRNWCRPLFDRLSIDPKEELSVDSEDRPAAGFRFVYRRASAAPDTGRSGQGPVVGGPEVLQPLAASAQADYIAAVTSVTAFAQCPRRYFLSRYLGLEPDREQPAPSDWKAEGEDDQRDGTDASQFGSEVHKYLAGELDSPTPAARRLAARFQQHDLGRRVAMADSVDREMAFVFMVGDYLLRGTVDLLFEEGGERILVDYKTDRVRGSDVRQAAAKYAPQLQLYAAGLAKSGRPAGQAVLFYLRCAEPVAIDIGVDAIAGAERLVGRFFEAQRRQEYPTKPGRQCRFCPYVDGPCPETYPRPGRA